MVFSIDKESSLFKHEIGLVDLAFKETTKKVEELFILKAGLSVNTESKEYDWSKHEAIIPNTKNRTLRDLCNIFYSSYIKYDKWYPFIQISKDTNKFRITLSQDANVKMAKIAADKSTIQNYGITDQSVLIEIAKLAAQAAVNGEFSQYIGNYGIKDKKALVEIAKLAAQQNGGATSFYIRNYGITDQSALIEIAKLAVQRCDGKISQYIRRYDIKDKKALVEIAKLAVQMAGEEISFYIKEYGITDQSILIEIAKLAAQQDGGGTSLYIEKYGITDQSVLIEIAKLAAQQDGGRTSLHIGKYGITDQSVLIEIAKLAAQQDGGGTSLHIGKYGITDQSVLIEIAKLAAQRSGAGTSLYIEKYGITDQSVLIEIAKLAAQQNGYITSKYINNYNIKDQSALAKIAKLAAQQDGGGTFEHIRKYGITDQKALIEIADLSMKTSILGNKISFLWKNLGNYVYSEKEQLLYLQLLCCCYNLDNDGNESMQKFISEHTIPKDFSSFLLFKESIADIEAKIVKTENSHKLKKLEKHKQRSLLYFSFVLEKCKNSNISLTEREQKYFIKVLKHPNIKEANFLLQTLAQNFDKSNYFSNYQKLISNKSKDIEHLIVPMIEISQWYNPNSSQEISDIKTFFTLRKQRESLKNAKGFLSNLLQAFMALHNTDLSPEQKLYLLNQCLQYAGKEEKWDIRCKRSLDTVNILAATSLLTPILRELDAKYDFEKVLVQFEVQLQEKIFSLAKPLENFNRKLLQVEEGLRVPWSIINYVSNVKKYANLSVSQEIQRFVVSILENTVQQERYQTQNNPHLTQIAEKFPLIYQAWQASQESVLVDFNNTKELSMDFSAFLRQKIIQDQHFPDASQQLLNYLQGHQVDTTSMQEEDKKILDLCKSLCELPGNLIQKLRILKHLLDIVKEQNEFKNDIKDLLVTLKKNPTQENILIVDTDDWQDLFLSGTEVLGSCQRIDGDPALNMCLMAYVLDGKNRMLAVKDPETKKILARSIFRLLWDPENNQPALFQERIYPYPCSEQYENLLNNLAEARAKELGLRLFTINQRSNCSTKAHFLESLGSCSPYEYSDASGGKMLNGKFVIKGAKVVVLK